MVLLTLVGRSPLSHAHDRLLRGGSAGARGPTKKTKDIKRLEPVLVRLLSGRAEYS